MAWKDREIAEELATRYGRAVNLPYRVTEWPDDGKQGPANSKSVDAIATAQGTPALAIEVTKIESFPDHLRDDATLNRLNASLAAELATLPSGLTFAIPYFALPPHAAKWKSIELAFREFLRAVHGSPPPGYSTHHPSGIPFEVAISYEPALDIAPRVSRIGPPQDVKRDALLKSVGVALQHKADELERFRRTGDRTILILDHHDMQSSSSARIYAGFFLAARTVGVSHLTDVFLCRTENPHRLDQWYCFRSTAEVLRYFNPTNFRFGPEHDAYWTEALRHFEW